MQQAELLLPVLLRVAAHFLVPAHCCLYSRLLELVPLPSAPVVAITIVRVVKRA
jgi:hypothetical protein